MMTETHNDPAGDDVAMPALPESFVFPIPEENSEKTDSELIEEIHLAVHGLTMGLQLLNEALVVMANRQETMATEQHDFISGANEVLGQFSGKSPLQMLSSLVNPQKSRG